MKHVFISGSSRGIGKATLLAFARQGNAVALNYLQNRKGAEDTAAEAREAGAPQVIVLQGDVGNPKDVDRMFIELSSKWSKLDVLFSNAGYSASGKFENIDFDFWKKAFDTHVHGAFLLCKSALPLLVKGTDPCIVITSSVAAIRGLNGAITYGTVKGALLQFTRCLAWELADKNIRVNAILPGIVRTDFHAAMTPQQQKHNLENRIPLHREGKPEQIAQMVLAMVENTLMTGAEVVVDGGLTMRMA
ncbi:MAG TPA: SDR family oxidoreductase [Candidatus Brocadiia bacterium]|nr:SDR family oxidoreductase [Candidatus Brocadiia bacterium]